MQITKINQFKDYIDNDKLNESLGAFGISKQVKKATNLAIKRLLSKLPTESVSQEEYQDLMSDIKRKIWNQGLKAGLFLDKETVLDSNIIDMSKFLASISDEDDLKTVGYHSLAPYDPVKFNDRIVELIEEDDAYNMKSILPIVPCFEKGVIKINKKRWFYFVIDKLDLEANLLTITLCDYQQEPSEGFKCNVKIHVEFFIDTDGNCVSLECSYVDGLELMKQSIEKGNFNSDEKLVITNVIIPSFKLFMKENLGAFISGSSDSEIRKDIYYLLQNFILCIRYVNAVLEKNTVERAKGYSKKTKKPVTKTTAISYNTVSSDKRRVRLISGTDISITSEKRPRTPDQEYVRHYSVATWTQRGFIRHLKSGKTTYIGPQTKHRHALNGAETNEVKTTLVVK